MYLLTAASLTISSINKHKLKNTTKLFVIKRKFCRKIHANTNSSPHFFSANSNSRNTHTLSSTRPFSVHLIHARALSYRLIEFHKYRTSTPKNASRIHHIPRSFYVYFGPSFLFSLRCKARELAQYLLDVISDTRR